MVFEEHADKIKASYNKMTQGNVKDIKQDEYYKYFYNLVDTGRNYADFSYVRLVKFVDEKWVNEIEEALPSLIKVVQNPRKFIEEEREVVNIAMARNISAESVRHLLAHSNYIDEYRKDGTVIPNKILNVYKEESLNTYENRFICTLIAELQFFINRRYHALFDASKDEMGVNFDIGSTIDNYSEVIDYKLKITIRDKQTESDNLDENKAIFARISDIYKKINMLTTTEFVATMRKFPAVHHPIVKTNAIAKNKDYKACHKLWNFIHTYTQVGYKVDMLKQDPNVSGQLKEDIYNSIVWHYAMLHNYMDDVDELCLDREKRKKQMDIPEMRGLLEQIVDGMDMQDERLRNLLLNELVNIQKRRKQEKEAAQQAAKEIKDKRESARLLELQQDLERQRYEDDLWEDIMFGGYDELEETESVEETVEIVEESVTSESEEVVEPTEENSAEEESVEEESVADEEESVEIELTKAEPVDEPEETETTEEIQETEVSDEVIEPTDVETTEEELAEISEEESMETESDETEEAVADEPVEEVEDAIEQESDVVVDELEEAEPVEETVEAEPVDEPEETEVSEEVIEPAPVISPRKALQIERKKVQKEMAIQIIEEMLDDINTRRRR